jgi:hypothetical protein
MRRTGDQGRAPWACAKQGLRSAMRRKNPSQRLLKRELRRAHTNAFKGLEAIPQAGAEGPRAHQCR